MLLYSNGIIVVVVVVVFVVDESECG